MVENLGMQRCCSVSIPPGWHRPPLFKRQDNVGFTIWTIITFLVHAVHMAARLQVLESLHRVLHPAWTGFQPWACTHGSKATGTGESAQRVPHPAWTGFQPWACTHDSKATGTGESAQSSTLLELGVPPWAWLAAPLLTLTVSPFGHKAPTAYSTN